MSEQPEQSGEKKRGKTFSDELLIAALASGVSAKQAAKQLGCNPRTVRRRLADEEFRGKVTQARVQVIGRVVGKVSSIAIRAARKLGKLIQSKDERIALQAARAVLSSTFQGAEYGVLAQELADLRHRIEVEEQRRSQEREPEPPTFT